MRKVRWDLYFSSSAYSTSSTYFGNKLNLLNKNVGKYSVPIVCCLADQLSNCCLLPTLEHLLLMRKYPILVTVNIIVIAEQFLQKCIKCVLSENFQRFSRLPNAYQWRKFFQLHIIIQEKKIIYQLNGKKRTLPRYLVTQTLAVITVRKHTSRF